MMSTVLVIAYFSPCGTMFYEAMTVKDEKKKKLLKSIVLQPPAIIKLERECTVFENYTSDGLNFKGGQFVT